MEKRLKNLFDYQKFEKNDHLDRLIQETMSRCEKVELSDDDLEFVNAAGTMTSNKPTTNK